MYLHARRQLTALAYFILVDFFDFLFPVQAKILTCACCFIRGCDHLENLVETVLKNYLFSVATAFMFYCSRNLFGDESIKECIKSNSVHFLIHEISYIRWDAVGTLWVTLYYLQVMFTGNEKCMGAFDSDLKVVSIKPITLIKYWEGQE